MHRFAVHTPPLAVVPKQEVTPAHTAAHLVHSTALGFVGCGQITQTPTSAPEEAELIAAEVKRLVGTEWTNFDLVTP